MQQHHQRRRFSSASASASAAALVTAQSTTRQYTAAQVMGQTLACHKLLTLLRTVRMHCPLPNHTYVYCSSLPNCICCSPQSRQRCAHAGVGPPASQTAGGVAAARSNTAAVKHSSSRAAAACQRVITHPPLQARAFVPNVSTWPTAGLCMPVLV
jgi:hypothetical protein